MSNEPALVLSSLQKKGIADSNQVKKLIIMHSQVRPEYHNFA